MSTTDERPQLDEIIAEGAPAPAEQPEQTSEPAPAEPSEQPQTWTYAALKDERSKRQRAQERIAELEQQLAVQQPQQTPADAFWDNPDATLGRMEAAARNATLRASRAELVAEHGHEALAEVEAAVGAAMKAGHPDIPLLRDAMLASDHPVAVAVQWVADQRQQQGGAPRRQAYPSNLSSARSVAARNPAWSGPTPLNDIFARGRS
jgi:hypothetical protein